MPPAYNAPARIAEEVATLDIVSPGRVDFGTGESSSRAELEGFNIDAREKRAMCWKSSNKSRTCSQWIPTRVTRGSTSRCRRGTSYRSRFSALIRLREALLRREQLVADDLLGAMEIMELMTMQDRYFSPEQRAALDARAQELGAGRFAQAEAEWSLLIAEVGAERQKGTPPSDARVLALAARWKALIEQFTGGDPGIRDSLATMYHAESAKAASRGTVPDEGLMAYIGEAMGHLT